LTASSIWGLSEAYREQVMKITLVSAAILLLVVGCASNVERFYHEQALPVGKQLPAFSGKTQIFRTTDHARDAKDMKRKGYIVLGVSAFNTTDAVTESMIRAQARKIGADTVLYFSSYMGAEQGVAAVLNYTPGETYVS